MLQFKFVLYQINIKVKNQKIKFLIILYIYTIILRYFL